MTTLIGINHVALEVGSIDEALAWYGRFFELEVQERQGDEFVFLGMGDQFLVPARPLRVGRARFARAAFRSRFPLARASDPASPDRAADGRAVACRARHVGRGGRQLARHAR